MKYIIEIKPEYEDKIRGVMLLGAENSNLYVDSRAAEELEELTADYINEHFPDLQYDAYHRGLAEGKKAFDLLDAERDAEYKRGFEDGKAVNDKGCAGCKYEGNGKDRSPCDYCCNGYANQWQAKQTDDEIKVGDEVRRKSAPENERGGIVTKDWENSYFIMWTDGSSGQWDKDRVVKTGRHFNISSILKEMQS